MRRDGGRADKTKVIATFRYFAKAPKILNYWHAQTTVETDTQNWLC